MEYTVRFFTLRRVGQGSAPAKRSRFPSPPLARRDHFEVALNAADGLVSSHPITLAASTVGKVCNGRSYRWRILQLLFTQAIQ